MIDGDSPDTTRVKASLGRLTGSNVATVIERGAEATDDVESAAQFVESIGLETLEAATAATDDPDLEASGRRTLATFYRFRRAAAGGSPSEEDHFRRGRGTDLRGDGERPSR